MPKKKFKDTTVGKLLLGAAKVINPALGNVLEGVISPSEAIKEITKSDISTEDKDKTSATNTRTTKQRNRRNYKALGKRQRHRQLSYTQYKTPYTCLFNAYTIYIHNIR